MIRLILLALLALAACKEDRAEAPSPVELTTEATGYFCQMNLIEHPGPKAQVHLDGLPFPLFFSQVRDALAYARMPEQSHIIAAIYVNDLGAAPSWEEMGAANWIAAGAAHYVIGSDRAGGMGAPEAVPFASRAEAEGFAARHGGDVLELADIPDAALLAPVAGAHDAPGDTDEFRRRLKALSPTEG
ncbi:nitrous oxide reductase accessory protein NosL [Roseovarius autotrophicus]|uniref:nitrous oxide reductase accessory protein NosL n=1 Tax=Roseovarius autotrophicus TaxID=2824121 RepID=UPI0019E7DD22|nr:nitrous oxide reductase accessory protein NosL [Roseovarius autotrophicus]MBE0452739.1 nitrous oxide reductase accessory protein NosL [Roseovarius sp.]